MKNLSLQILFALCTVTTALAADPASVSRGRYLSIIGGCNDCHTPHFAHSGGKVPENEWLIGDPTGWKGPWGTTYAANLRKLLHPMDKKTWLIFARAAKPRPPMPSYMFQTMNDQDLGALFDFIQSLGDAGVAAPAYLPPGVDPTGPYFDFTIKNPQTEPQKQH